MYACTSHVLATRTYDRAYALCHIDDIIESWKAMNYRFSMMGAPYEVNGNRGKNWCDTCEFCYYKHNNRLLHTVANEMPDKNFT